MQQQLHGRNAVVTGASEGIGFAIAKALAKEGAGVCLLSRSPNKLEVAQKELIESGATVETIVCDLSDSTQIASLKEHISEVFNHVDILVNNAGTARFTPFSEVVEDEFDEHVNLNIKAPYLLTQSLLEELTQAKGVVINVSSYFSHRMLPGRPSTAYSLSKGTMDSFTYALAYELGPLGIRVNAIAPGTVMTNLVEKNLSALNEEGRARFYEMVNTLYPLQRIGEPEDIGGAAVFLATDAARWITGAIIPVDGGLTTN